MSAEGRATNKPHTEPGPRARPVALTAELVPTEDARALQARLGDLVAGERAIRTGAQASAPRGSSRPR